MQQFWAGLKRFVYEEDGQDFVEYSLLVSFLVLACIAVLNDAASATRSVMLAGNSALSTASSFAAS